MFVLIYYTKISYDRKYRSDWANITDNVSSRWTNIHVQCFTISYQFVKMFLNDNFLISQMYPQFGSVLSKYTFQFYISLILVYQESVYYYDTWMTYGIIKS